MAAPTHEESDVFQDFDSDNSDFDDDVDWNFTDGESASVLELMSGAASAKKAQLNRTAAEDTSASPKAINCRAAEVSTESFSDEELLNELFPETQPKFTTEVEKPTEPQVDEECRHNKEYEVEWALMALEEHEQLNHQACSTAPATAERGLDFVSLFEKMYGDDSTIEVSTPSPPAKSNKGNSDSTLPDEPQSAQDCEMKSSPTILENSEGNVPSEIIDMLRRVYKKAVETQEDLSPLVKDASCRLCVLEDACQIQPVCSLSSFIKAACSLEETLTSQKFVASLASTREERLELVITALDDTVGALPPSLKVKWAKMIDMLPLLAKMRGQTTPSAPTSDPVVDQPAALQIDSKTFSPTKPKKKERSPLQGWATFHPEKMPAKRYVPIKVSKPTSSQMATNKPRVRIRQYVPTKLRVRCKVYNPEDSELTFRPKINKQHLHHRNGEPKEQEETFAARMERDISHRRSQRLQHELERAQLNREEAESTPIVNLIAKGSQRILLRNGTWTESLEDRIHRLAKHRANVEVDDSLSRKRRQRREKKKREATAIASRACESLYQRGIEQRRREQERLQEDTHDLEFQRNRPKMSSRSLGVMKARIRQELAQLCMDSQRTAKTVTLEVEGEARNQNPSFVTFIQFSCALLYFGFVADLNTLWEGNTSDDDNKITLLWHSWTVFMGGGTGVADPRLGVHIKMLERVLFSVILGGRAGDHPLLQSREVQTLLRLYRANYYARKHTQLKTESNSDRNQNISRAQRGNVETNKRRSSRRHRVRYSLHGKPIRDTDAPETDYLSERELLLRERIGQMREDKVKHELDGCTFHPRINPGPAEATALRTEQNTPPCQSSRSSSATVSTFERLYSDAFQRQNNVLEKYLEAKLQREEQERRECKVHPRYVNGLTIEERLENLHAALAGNALPVDFHKKIDSMRTATKMKALNEKIKEQRLQPAQFRRAEDGRTIVLPFQFATQIRVAKSSELKKQRAETCHRPRDYVMKGLRPLSEEDERGVPTPVHPLRKNRACSDDREADLCLDVHVSPTETQQLYMNFHDDPREVVKRFAQRFSLTNTQRHFLIQLVETRLEQFASAN